MNLNCCARMAADSMAIPPGTGCAANATEMSKFTSRLKTGID